MDTAVFRKVGQGKIIRSHTLMKNSLRTAVFFFMILPGLKEAAAGPDQEIMRQIHLARAFEDSGEWNRAREIYERIYRQEPENPVVLDPYFECCLKLRSFKEALSIVDRRLLNHAGDVHAACLRARALARSGLKTQALQEWNRLCGLRPKDESIVRAVAEAMVREQLIEEAVGIYKKGREDTASPERFALELSSLYELSGDFGNAALELMIHYRGHPERRDEVQIRFARFPRTESASGQLFRQMKKMPEILTGNEWLFRLFLQAAYSSGNDDPVFEFTEDSERRGGTGKKGNLLILLAEEAFQSARYSTAEKAYRVILEKYPDFPKRSEMSIGLARCFQAQKKYREALFYYNEAIDKKTDRALTLKALQEKGRISMVFLEDFNEAKIAFQVLISNFPNSAELGQWTLDLGRCEMMLGNLAGADSIFQDVLESEKRKVGGNWIQAAVLLAETRYYRTDIDESMKVLDQLSSPEVNGEYLRDPLFNDALELKMFLREFYGRCPECVRLYARAEFKQKQKKLVEASAVLDSISAFFAGNGMEAEVLLKKAELAFQLARYKESRELIQRFQDQFPDHPKTLQALMLSAGVAEKTGNERDAVDQYDRVLREFPYTLSAEESKEHIRALQERMKP
jgi:tetratricopeptide (TPR) repeat protein